VRGEYVGFVNVKPDRLFYRGLGYGLFGASLMWGALVGVLYYLI
jgi:hypothetical protein